MSIINVIAKQLADKGTVLLPKHNTIYTAINEFGRDSGVVKTATAGLASRVKEDVNLYRNVILPVTMEIESAIKSAATGRVTSVSDKVTIHTTSYHTAFDTLVELEKVDPSIVASYDGLPVENLHIEFDEELVLNNVTLQNNRIKSYVDDILVEYSDGYLEEIHNKIFSNVTKHNEYLRAIAVDPIGNHDEVFLGLAMTLGYITGTLGVSNIPSDRARTSHLYALRDMFISILANYRRQYRRHLDLDILIARIKHDGAKVDVYLVGESYETYLEDNSVDAIIGYALTHKNSSVIALERFVETIDRSLEAYSEAMRVASMRSSINHLKVLAIAYKTIFRKHIKDMSEQDLAVAGISSDEVNPLCDIIDNYVNDLDGTELLEVTATVRYITGEYVYGDTGFLKFVESMRYYSKVFPKFTVTEIATTAMVARTMDILEPQLVEGDSTSTGLR